MQGIGIAPFTPNDIDDVINVTVFNLHQIGRDWLDSDVTDTVTLSRCHSVTSSRSLEETSARRDDNFTFHVKT